VESNKRRGVNVTPARTGSRAEALEVLTRQECLRLLAQGRLGRVAGFGAGDLLTVVPVRFALVGDHIVFIADSRSRLDTTRILQVEVDLIDPAEGWSVVITGRAAEVADEGELRRLRAFLGGAVAADARLFRLPTERLSGRRIVRQPMYVAGSIRAAAVSTRPAEPGRATDTAPNPVDDVHLESLATEECLRCLASAEVGRLVVVLGGEPHIFPVNYALDGDAIVFRTAPGTKLEGTSRSLVAFQVDHLPAGSATGWSVLVQGIAQEIASVDAPSLRERIDALHVRSWASGDRLHFVRILPIAVTGTRYGIAYPPGPRPEPDGSGPSALGKGTSARAGRCHFSSHSLEKRVPHRGEQR
jgi:nitroimidazol reductase NimA-like FMN-containing flavoprotein (pyridoxamine 5'-phosphate oxidase superfamily)